jgi:hypothetical protein
MEVIMKKILLSGVSVIVYLTILVSTLFINNTVNEQFNFTNNTTRGEKSYIIIERRHISYERVMSEKK